MEPFGECGSRLLLVGCRKSKSFEESSAALAASSSLSLSPLPVSSRRRFELRAGGAATRRPLDSCAASES